MDVSMYVGVSASLLAVKNFTLSSLASSVADPFHFDMDPDPAPNPT